MAVPDPFDLLDIACGDAGQMRTALAGTKIRHYRGLDLSEPALELAAKNLDGAPFNVDLDCGDFVATLTGQQDRSDVSWCSLSIHHLNTDGKRNLLRALHESTSKFLMIYEPTMLEGEDRAAYLERFERINKLAWTFFTPEEWNQPITTSRPATYRKPRRPGRRSAAKQASPRPGRSISTRRGSTVFTVMTGSAHRCRH